FRRLRLREALFFDEPAQRCHQLRPHPQVSTLSLGEAQIRKYVAATFCNLHVLALPASRDNAFGLTRYQPHASCAFFFKTVEDVDCLLKPRHVQESALRSHM